jgi:hypothetical protein
MPTLHLLSDLLGSDAVVFDDRALNKEPWDYLTAPVEGSVTLAEFIEKELRVLSCKASMPTPPQP